MWGCFLSSLLPSNYWTVSLQGIDWQMFLVWKGRIKWVWKNLAFATERHQSRSTVHKLGHSAQLSGVLGKGSVLYPCFCTLCPASNSDSLVNGKQLEIAFRDVGFQLFYLCVQWCGWAWCGREYEDSYKKHFLQYRKFFPTFFWEEGACVRMLTALRNETGKGEL